MNITLVDVRTMKAGENKDLAGGLGTLNKLGDSMFLRVLSRLKGDMINLPLMCLGYLTSVMRSGGNDVRLSRGETVEGTDVYLVYTSLIRHEDEMEFARRIRGGTAKVGFFGALCTVAPEMFLEHGDFVITGEAEGLSPEIFRNLAGRIDAGLVGDLDGLPFPDWSGFNYHDFRYSTYIKERPVFPVLSSRGCPNACGYYCPYPAVQGRKFRARSPENVLQEVKRLVMDYGAKGIMFRDPIFTLDMDRAALITERFIKSGLDISWACETSLVNLDEGLIKIMKRSGLKGINLGIESSDPDVLKSLGRKSLPQKRIQEIVKLCRSLGIKIGAFYILGNMADTRESIEDTIRFSRSLNTDYAQFTIATTYPGTGFDKDMDGLKCFRDWQDLDACTPVFKHPSLSREQLISLKAKAMRSYYLRPRWLLSRLGAL